MIVGQIEHDDMCRMPETSQVCVIPFLPTKVIWMEYGHQGLGPSLGQRRLNEDPAAVGDVVSYLHERKGGKKGLQRKSKSGILTLMKM